MQETKAVIFDLDGTLLYTLEDLADSTNYALSKYGYPKRTVKEVRSFVGNGVQKLIERAIPDGINNPYFSECLDVFKKHYKDNMYNRTCPYDGVLEMLASLKNSGIKTAVVSNKFDAAVKELCEKYFPHCFEVCVGESESVRKKPAPDSVLKVMELIGTKDFNKDNFVYVGDSEVDIQTAKNAGIPCISVDWGYKDKEFLQQNGAKTIVSSVSELTKKIEEIFSLM